MEQELQKEPKCSFYALEQLRQTAESILRGSQRLLKCRAGVEKTARRSRSVRMRTIWNCRKREARFLRCSAMHSGIFWNWRSPRLP